MSCGIEWRSGYRLGPERASDATAFPSNISFDDGLTDEEAVTLALWNNAAFHAAIADLGLSRADLIQAGLLTNPVLSMLFPVGPKQLEFTLTFPIEALWLRPKRLDVASLDWERVAEQLVQNGLDLIRDVRSAGVDVWLAKRRLALAEEALRLRTRIANLTEARLRAGDISELEVALVRGDVLRSQEENTRIVADVELARERLRFLVGLTFAPEPVDWVDSEPSAAPSWQADELVDAALAARPDVRAAEFAVEAASKRVGLTQVEYLTFSALLDSNAQGSEGFEIGPGLEVMLPIFHQNQGRVARSKAELERAARLYVARRQQVALEVRQTYIRYRQVHTAQKSWSEGILPQFEAALERANKAFENGQTSLLFVLETTRQLLDGRARELELAADLRRAWAELERSVGRRIVFPGPSPSPIGIDPDHPFTVSF